MDANVDTDVVCPFYHADEGVRVKCEGFCKSNTLQISFCDKAQFKTHKYNHCCNMKGYKRCPLYDVINRQYEGT